MYVHGIELSQMENCHDCVAEFFFFFFFLVWSSLSFKRNDDGCFLLETNENLEVGKGGISSSILKILRFEGIVVDGVETQPFVSRTRTRRRKALDDRRRNN